MITEERAAVIAEARTWINTAFAHQQKCKGAGVDCGYLLAEIYRVAIPGWPGLDFGNYGPQWMMHKDEDANFYVGIVQEHCVPMDHPDSGDIVLFKFGRGYSHGGIVVSWPEIIHADARTAKRVVRENVRQTAFLNSKPRLFFSPKQWH